MRATLTRKSIKQEENPHKARRKSTKSRHLSTIFLSRPHNQKVKWKNSPSLVQTSPFHPHLWYDHTCPRKYTCKASHRLFKKEPKNLLLVVELFLLFRMRSDMGMTRVQRQKLDGWNEYLFLSSCKPLILECDYWLTSQKRNTKKGLHTSSNQSLFKSYFGNTKCVDFYPNVTIWHVGSILWPTCFSFPFSI